MKTLFKLALTLLLLGCFYSPGYGQRDDTLKPIEVDGKWGYEENGKVVIRARYDRALPFKKGIAKVAIRDPNITEDLGDRSFLWGMIDATGRIFVQPQFHQLSDFSEIRAAAAKLKNTRGNRSQLLSDSNLLWGYIDPQGTLVVPLQFHRAGDFSERVAVVSLDDDSGGLCSRRGKFGYIDITGAMVIKPEYAIALPFKGGKARVGRGIIDYVGRCLCCNPEFKGQWGYVDKLGNFTPDSNSGAQ